MERWTDLFLALPLPEPWLRGLLFVTFGLHLLFVLLMLGTALLGLFFYLRARTEAAPGPQDWNRRLVGSHLGLKSLAVVLGVGPLLVIQVLYSHAFFTATGLFAYAWLAVIPLLIFAFLTIDGFGHTMERRPWLPLALGVLGVAALLTVPAVFTGAMALMERPEAWTSFARNGAGGAPGLLSHWVLRYLHVVGAALVFGAAFHLFFSVRQRLEQARRLRAWVFGATLFQVVVGVPLVFSVAHGMDWPVLLAVTAGAAGAVLVLWSFRPEAEGSPNARARRLLWLLPVVFVAMLAARQFLQDAVVTQDRTMAQAERARRSQAWTPYRAQALEAFRAKLDTAYDTGPVIYEGSCSPCHGSQGRGDGPAARRLLVPAEDLSAMRVDRDYVYRIISQGIPGSAMPYFTVFDRDKLEAVLDELADRFTLFGPTQAPAPTGDDAAARAATVWNGTCATCHAKDGAISDFGRTLRPEPPDLRRLSLLPKRSLAIITDGYPGTVMQPYRDLPEAVRQDLAIIAAELRRNR